MHICIFRHIRDGKQLLRVPCFVITHMCGLSVQAGGCNTMRIWDDRQILALLLQVTFLPVAFLAVVNNSVAYRKSTTQKTNFRTIKYKGICQKIITIFSYSFSLGFFSGTYFSLERFQNSFPQPEKFDREDYMG